MRSSFQLFLMSVEDAQLQHLSLEIASVQLFLQDGLIEVLQVLHGEFFG